MPEPFKIKKQLRELTASLDTTKQLRELTALLDTTKQLRELTASLDTTKQLRELTASLDTTKQLRELTASLDTTKQLRELANQLTSTQISRWTEVLAPALSAPADEALTNVAEELASESRAGDEPIPRWLPHLPDLAQRRLLLLVLAALWAMTDAVDSFAGVTPPDHLDKLVVALLAVATALNEIVGDAPRG